ncbi:MAG TPA: hypothetical protein PKH79_10150 [Prolixibacteraceae bacterium]|nr:hypothetical protein [Prolixibacteraceae bacterium]HPS13264.1 hypothetical protein [Prolixibacteraceae bacterium]
MKSTTRLIVLSILVLAILSCGPSQQEKAAATMDEAQQFISNGDTLKAIETLRKVHTLYPKASEQISASEKRIDELFGQLTDSRKEQINSCNKKIAELEKNFKKEKTEFDLYKQYIPNELSFNRSWNKSFLQVNLDERGEISLTSHYMGKDWIKHTSIKIYDDGLEFKAPEVPLDSPNNRESDFLDYKWEKVTYTGSIADSTIRFIAQHSNRQLKCVFIGKSHYYIILEDFNKEAIKNGYNLSVALKDKAQTEKQLKELEELEEKWRKMEIRASYSPPNSIK